MNKSQIRKKILKIRKINNSKKYNINFETLLKVIKKNNLKGKILGGYYSFNYEIDAIQILEKLEKQNYIISLPRIKRGSKMDFFEWSSKEPLSINKYGIPEPISKKINYPDILLFQKVKKIPINKYDIKLDFVITEKQN